MISEFFGCFQVNIECFRINYDTIVVFGAGVGNPLERDIDAVRDDVRDELVSLESAKNDYGVIIDPQTLNVNLEATEKLRNQMLADQK